MILERAGFAAGEQWSERSWLGELLGEGRTILIARAHHPVGVICFQTIGELADLHRLVVAPQYRRRGIGVDLVRAGLLAVRHLGAKAVILEVDYGNEPAIALYQGSASSSWRPAELLRAGPARVDHEALRPAMDGPTVGLAAR